jgi:hypothetical protein
LKAETEPWRFNANCSTLKTAKQPNEFFRKPRAVERGVSGFMALFQWNRGDLSELLHAKNC